MTEAKIRKLVRDQICSAIQEDIDGGESLMKEVWEQLECSDEDAIAKAEMRRIIALIKAPA